MISCCCYNDLLLQYFSYRFSFCCDSCQFNDGVNVVVRVDCRLRGGENDYDILGVTNGDDYNGVGWGLFINMLLLLPVVVYNIGNVGALPISFAPFALLSFNPTTTLSPSFNKSITIYSLTTKFTLSLILTSTYSFNFIILI